MFVHQALPDNSFERPRCGLGNRSTIEERSKYESDLQAWCGQQEQQAQDSALADADDADEHPLKRVSNMHWVAALHHALKAGTGHPPRLAIRL